MAVSNKQANLCQKNIYEASKIKCESSKPKNQNSSSYALIESVTYYGENHADKPITNKIYDFPA